MPAFVFVNRIVKEIGGTSHPIKSKAFRREIGR